MALCILSAPVYDRAVIGKVTKVLIVETILNALESVKSDVLAKDIFPFDNFVRLLIRLESGSEQT